MTRFTPQALARIRARHAAAGAKGREVQLAAIKRLGFYRQKLTAAKWRIL